VFSTYLSAQQISCSAILPVHFIAFVIEYLLEETHLCVLSLILKTQIFERTICFSTAKQIMLSTSTLLIKYAK